MKTVQSTPPITNDICWVYIFWDKAADKYDIRFGSTPPGKAEPFGVASGLQMVFVREFSDMFTALGYRVVLSSLSIRSLRRFIQNQSYINHSDK